MKANYTNKAGYNLNPTNRKEKHFYKQITAVVFNTETRNAFDCVTLRLYATSARHYCCLWVHQNCAWIKDGESYGSKTTNGSGNAGGYGYHRASAAAEVAISSAGILLDERIGGRGDRAIVDAVIAIAREVYPDEEKFLVHISESHA